MKIYRNLSQRVHFHSSFFVSLNVFLTVTQNIGQVGHQCPNSVPLLWSNSCKKFILNQISDQIGSIMTYFQQKCKERKNMYHRMRKCRKYVPWSYILCIGIMYLILKKYIKGQNKGKIDFEKNITNLKKH